MKKPKDEKLPNNYLSLSNFKTNLLNGKELKDNKLYDFFDKKVVEKIIPEKLYKVWYNKSFDTDFVYFVGYVEEIPKKILELAKKRVQITKQIEEYIKEK